ncbi:MAG: GNAT family N-acetyltransferase [Candidatus Micrarchaeia archaeon]
MLGYFLIIKLAACLAAHYPLSKKGIGLEMRKAGIADLESIHRVELDAFSADRQASMDALEERLELFPDGFFVLIYNGRLVGFSTALLIDDFRTLEKLDSPDRKLHKPDGEIYYLRSVAIMKEYQKRGFGKLLINRQLENARSLGKGHFRFTASKDVEAFYLELGFKKLGVYGEFHNSKQVVWEFRLAD